MTEIITLMRHITRRIGFDMFKLHLSILRPSPTFFDFRPDTLVLIFFEGFYVRPPQLSFIVRRIFILCNFMSPACTRLKEYL